MLVTKIIPQETIITIRNLDADTIEQLKKSVPTIKKFDLKQIEEPEQLDYILAILQKLYNEALPTIEFLLIIVFPLYPQSTLISGFRKFT